MDAAVVDTKLSPNWRDELRRYTQPRLNRSLFDLGTSVVPYLILLGSMFAAARLSVVPVLVLAFPAAGFLLRSFIVFHDCAHGSFFRTRRATTLLGRGIGLLVWLPFRCWQHEHAVHHATAGNLDRRGIGDITTLTVTEYEALPTAGRIGYRLFRNPVVMFGFGWLLVLVLKPRFVPREASRSVRNSVLATNLAIALIVTTMCWLVGWRDYLLVQGTVFLIAGAVGVFLFYVQHQFEDTYWQSHGDWQYEEAALKGSSYLKLPPILQFFTGNIGFHHVHHLSVGIPNYNLQHAHESSERLRTVPELTLRDALRVTRLKLWDERTGRLVTFRDAGVFRQGRH